MEKKFIPLHEGARLPEKSTEGAAAYDLFASEDIIVPSLFFNSMVAASYEGHPRTLSLEEAMSANKFHKLSATLVPTGISVSMNSNEHVDIRPRSGVASKALLLLPNSLGLIDSDYVAPSEIFIPMINLGINDVQIRRGDRIGQIIFMSHEDASNGVVTERQREVNGGFNHTGTR